MNEKIMKRFENLIPDDFCRAAENRAEFCRNFEEFSSLGEERAFITAIRILDGNKMNKTIDGRILLDKLLSRMNVNYLLLFLNDVGQDFVVNNASWDCLLSMDIELLARRYPIDAELFKKFLDVKDPRIVVNKFWVRQEEAKDEIVSLLLNKVTDLRIILRFDPEAWVKLGIKKFLLAGISPYEMLERGVSYVNMSRQDIEDLMEAGISLDDIVQYFESQTLHGELVRELMEKRK